MHDAAVAKNATTAKDGKYKISTTQQAVKRISNYRGFLGSSY